MRSIITALCLAVSAATVFGADDDARLKLESVHAAAAGNGTILVIGITNDSGAPVKAFRAGLFSINDFDEIKKVCAIEFTGSSEYRKGGGDPTYRHIIKPRETIYYNFIALDDGSVTKAFSNDPGKLPLIEKRFKFQVDKLSMADAGDLASENPRESAAKGKGDESPPVRRAQPVAPEASPPADDTGVSRSPSPPMHPASETARNTPADTGRRFLLAAATEYILAANSDNIDDEMKFYAARVDYYGEGMKSREDILADRLGYRERWTSRRFQLAKILRTDYDAAQDVGSITVRCTFEVSNDQKQKTGEAESVIRFRSVSRDPQVIFVAERQAK